MHCNNLEQMLNEIIKAYGKNDGYAVPTISWSKENMTSRFGEYQFWHNHIIVSNMLNTDSVSENAIKSVIFHEYTHQIYKEHNSAFNARMRLFKGYNKCQKELETFFNEVTEFPEAEKTDIILDIEQEIVFCMLPYDTKDIDSYWKHYLYFNHYITGLLPHKIPKEYCNKTTKQVVWVVESADMVYVVGWSKDVEIYADMQKVDVKDLAIVFDYQFRYMQKNGKTLLPGNAMEALCEHEIPTSLRKQGICNANDVDSNVVKEIVEMVNAYDGDYMDYGIMDKALNCIPEIETEDVSELIQKYHDNEDNRDRAFLIMNKAVNIEKSYRTFLYRGLAFLDCWILDKALSDLSEALRYDNDTKEPIDKTKIETLTKRLKEMKSLYFWESCP